ncbi:terminase [archaeon]|nr:terminase [archaeon]
MSNKQEGYLGNPNLKEAGIEIEFTKEQVKEYIKCSKDPAYFIGKYIRIVSLDEGLVPFNMYDFQEELVNLIHDNRFVIAKLPRQTGKSTTIIAYLLHYVMFNQSMSVAVLANKQSVARDILSRLKLAYEYLPLWLQQGILEWNKGSIHLENGSKIIASSTSSSAIRGGSYNTIFLDEFAHIPNNIAEEFFSSVYPTISSGKNTKVIMVSTPNGLNMFYYYWQGANKRLGTSGKNEYVPFEVHWSQVPGRDEKWKEETIRNTSKQQFEQEMECSFLGSQNTLISSDKLRILSWKEPIIKNPDGLYTYEKPKEDHTYFITVDTSRGQGKDYSAFVVVDTTEMPYKLVAKYRNNVISPMVFPTAIAAVAEQYNKAYVLIEINDIGGQVADVLHQDLEYENVMMAQYKGRAGQTVGAGFGGKSHLGVRTTTPVKKLGCSVLKSLIEEDKMLVEDMDIVNELTTFVAKRNSFEADDGHTDDLVMSLVLFSWLTRQTYFKDLTNTDVRIGIYEEEIEGLEENIAPFGFIPAEEEASEWDGNDRWFDIEVPY